MPDRQPRNRSKPQAFVAGPAPPPSMLHKEHKKRKEVSSPERKEPKKKPLFDSPSPPSCPRTEEKIKSGKSVAHPRRRSYLEVR